MDRGYVKLWRKIKDNTFWKVRPFSPGQAWVDILMNANHKDNEVLYNWEIRKILRGSFITTQRDLAFSWGWERSKVRRFLRSLQRANMIVTETDPKATHITILNYNIYQEIRPKNDPHLTQSTTTVDPQLTLNKNDKNDKNDKKKIIVPDFIPLDLWQEFKKMRTKIKATMTEEAERLAFKKLEKMKSAGEDPKAVIEQSIMNSWKGLFPVKNELRNEDDEDAAERRFLEKHKEIR